MAGKYYTPRTILDPQAGSGAFLKDAADMLLQNPPYEPELCACKLPGFDANDPERCPTCGKLHREEN